jgi:hypothetical protein
MKETGCRSPDVENGYRSTDWTVADIQRGLQLEGRTPHRNKPDSYEMFHITPDMLVSCGHVNRLLGVIESEK